MSAEKIAIVGMAFRFPGGAVDEESFWDMLREGRDAMTILDDSRWDTQFYYHPSRAEPGKSITLSAGLLDRVDAFDASFFGISPREADQMDPQQRLLLELAWEAMENAGQPPASLAGTETGVFVGISSLDYGTRSLDDISVVDAHFMTGNTLSIAANRLSYVFDLRGPSMIMDTACSSSMIALHQACRSLQMGEVPTALVGGMHLLLHPYPFVGFTKASMLSARGRCRAFDASGDGYARSEGGAMLLLKPLAQAEADGDQIHAVIMATGANADGADKSGITIPSSQGQASLLRKVLDRAGLAPEDIHYMEAHGTGTAIGDPIETAAIGEVLGAPKQRSEPLPIGSVKTNLGHLEPASGMAGLVKTILCLKHRALPPSIHLENPNPRIDFAGLNLVPVTQLHSLETVQGPLRMGVNSFGFGGANGHALLEEYVGKPATFVQVPPQIVPPLFLSARSPEALAALAAQHADQMRTQSDVDYYDWAYSAAHHRQWLDQRLAVWGESTAGIVERLEAFASGDQLKEVAVDDALPSCSDVAFVFSGNGAQWATMGRELLAESALFQETVAEIQALLGDRVDYDLAEALVADEQTSRMAETEVAQPTLFAMQVGITRLLLAQGVKARYMTGHSVGEVAAAWAAGALSLAQAVDVIFERSAAQGRTRGCGRMAAAALSAEEAMDLVAQQGLSDQVELAGVNSPSAVTLSGKEDALKSLAEIAESRGVFFRLLDLDYAFHSQHMDAIQEQLVQDLSALKPAASEGVFVSTVSGSVMAGTQLGAEYWWHNIRKPVQFAQAIGEIIYQGCRCFIEISPHAIMQRYVRDCMNGANIKGRVLPTLKRQEGGLARVQDAAYRAWLVAGPFVLEDLFPQPGQRVALPTYPWQRERHWAPRSSEAYALIHRTRVHPLLGWRLKDSAAAWENQVCVKTYPFLKDHQVADGVVFPGAGYVEMALAASLEIYGGETHELEEMEILVPMVFDGDHMQLLHFEMTPEDGRFRISSRRRLTEDPWSLHVVGRLVGKVYQPRPEGIDPAHLIDTTAEPVPAENHYEWARRLGLAYGSAFQTVEQLWCQDKTVVAKLCLPELIEEGLSAYHLHPALLDASFQVLVDVYRERIQAGDRATLLPVRVGRLRLFDTQTVPVWSRTWLLRESPHSVLAGVQLYDAEGQTVAVLDGCRFRGAHLVQDGVQPPAQWRYKRLVKSHPRTEAAPMVPLAGLVESAHALLLEQEEALLREDHFQQVLPLLDALIGAYANQALRNYVTEQDGDENAVIQALLSHPRLGAYLRWLCGVLEEDGFLEQHEDVWSFTEESAPPAHEIWLALLGDHPEYVADLICVGRVGLQLPQLLRGDSEADAFVASMDSGNMKHQLYADSLVYSAIDSAVADMVREVAAAWPENRRLRILEVAGTYTRFTDLVLPHLPEERCDYLLADVDQESFDFRALDFSGHPFVDILLLDQETLTAEGLGGEPYDLILVNQVLHQIGALQPAMAQLKSLLSPGGLLVFMERNPDRSVDFVSGLQVDWWGHGEHADGSSSMMTPVGWSRLLEEVGFESPQAILEPQGEETASGAFAMAALNPVDAAVSAQEIETHSWLFLCDPAGGNRALAESLCAAMKEAGQIADLMVLDTHCPLPELNWRDAEGRSLDHLVYLVGLNGQEEADDVDPLAVSQQRCLPLLALLHEIEVQAISPRLWLLTSGAVVADPMGQGGCHHIPSQAALWGMGRVVRNEYPDLQSTLIDLQHDQGFSELVRPLVKDLLYPDGEDEILLTDRGREVLRMEPQKAALEPVTEEAMPDHVSLGFEAPGQLKNLQWLPLTQRSLAEDEIAIEPRATGLNFRDVMYTMGLLSDEAVENGFSGPTLGLELAGVVTEVGAEVTRFVPGDAVVAFGPACFSTRVVTKAASAAPKPAEWTFREAATVPTVFFTVYYALHYLARLRPGERILIHGAAGGVGIAAIQLARYLGAEVFATAGSDEKRDFVRLLGADHVMNSRDLSYADQVLSLTGGEGVDVVLNSLAGEAINRNLRVLRPFGRFLELGKRDFYENTRIGLRPFKDNITYYGIDADQLMVERPELTQDLFREMMELFEGGALRPLPYRAFPADRVIEAFRYMQQSKQIGKIVVTFDEPPTPSIRPVKSEEMPVLSGEGTYLVTGGINGFGLESARWLARQGAGHLVLMGRRGEKTPGAVEAVAELEALGAQVMIKAADVTDWAQLSSLITELRRELPPIRGVLHAAMVLEDGLLRNMSAEQFQVPLAAKVRGGWYLHLLTQDLPLDFFILYSSATTYIGNPGQANYVAANFYLESLAAYRHSQGLPATCAAWGAIDDVGYLARHEEVKDALQSRLGGEALRSAAALEQLGVLMNRDACCRAVIDLDWSVLDRFLPASDSLRFEPLRRSSKRSGSDLDQADDLRVLMEQHTQEEVVAMLIDLVADEVAQIMRLPKERIAPDRSLYDLGMDSLMAVELVVSLEKRFGIAIPVMALSQSPTMNRIAEIMTNHLYGDGGSVVETEAVDVVSSMAKQHGIDSTVLQGDETSAGGV